MTKTRFRSRLAAVAAGLLLFGALAEQATARKGRNRSRNHRPNVSFRAPTATAAYRPIQVQAPKARPGTYLTFFGAAGTVTGSAHLLTTNGRRVLVDCGMYQGPERRKTGNDKLPAEAVAADCMLLTHAHIDHSGRIPLLVKRGFKGQIHCTKPTFELCKALLEDSARIHERRALDELKGTQAPRGKKSRRKRDRRLIEEAKKRALYNTDDVKSALQQFVAHDLDKPFSPTQGVSAKFTQSGHILGAASVAVDTTVNGKKRRIAFSGDIGRRGSALLPDPKAPQGADYVVMESTYGAKPHKPTVDMKQQLEAVVRQAKAKGGKVVIPSFALQRTQEIVHLFKQLSDEGKLKMPVYVDSPLGVRMTEAFGRNTKHLNAKVRSYGAAKGNPFSFPGLKLVSQTADSMALNKLAGPAVIISSAGMCTAGRIQHHLRNTMGDPKNTIAIVGYQGEGTLGRTITQRPSSVEIGGKTFALRAQVKLLDAFSAHAGQTDLKWWAKSCGAQVKRFFLVHGEPASSKILGQHLQAAGAKVTIPGATGHTVPLD